MLIIRLISLVCALTFLLPGLTVAAAGSDDENTFTLERCLTSALARNPSLASVRALLEAEEADVRSSRKDLYPIFAATYNASLRKGSNGRFQDDIYGYGLTVTQPIYRGKALVTELVQQRLQVQAAAAELVYNRNNLILTVHRLFNEALKAKRLYEVAQQALGQLLSHRRDAEAFFQVGLIPKNDLLQSEVQLAEGELELVKSANALDLAKALLNTLLGRPVHAPLLLVDTERYEAAVALDWEKLLRLAMENRPELARSESESRQAENNLQLVKADYLPAVFLTAGYGKEGDSPSARFNPDGASEDKYLSASLEWRFWSWGQDQDRHAAALRRFNAVQHARESLKESIIIENRKAFLSVLQSAKHIQVTRQAIVQAEENFRINTARYQSQLATSTDVLAAQTLLTRTRSNYFSALYDYGSALVELDRATGVIATDKGLARLALQ